MEHFIHLKILLPFTVFADECDVMRLSVETSQGSYGFLPNRLDCTATIVPGILSYESQRKGEVYLAVDEGVLVKTGGKIFVSVRNAIGGSDFGKLHQAVENEFLTLDEHEKNVRAVLARLESNFIRRLTQFQKE